jgi:DNA-directed RNA polymerase specialized sigma24 family protein
VAACHARAARLSLGCGAVDLARVDRDQLPARASADGSFQRAGGAGAVRRRIAALPDGYRDVFVLHDIEGYTHDEIASLLAIEAGTSKSQLSRARRALRAALNGASR